MGIVLSFEGGAIEMKAGESVLDALERAGAAPAFSCRSGVCHSCLMCVVDGEVDARAVAGLSPGMRAQGAFLPCVCFPGSDLSVAPVDGALSAMEAEIIGVSRVSSSVVRVLVSAGDFTWSGGHFVNVIRIEDGLTRPYSVASRVVDGHVELHVEVVENGEMSSWLAEREVGQAIRLRGPSGECIYVDGESQRPLVLAGVGTGLAPLLGVVREALAAGHAGDIHLFHGAREAEGLYLYSDLRDLAERHSNLDFHACVLGEPDRPEMRREAVDDAVLGLGDVLTAARVYLCGGTRWVKGMQRKVFLAGASMSRIHADAFVQSHQS